jgi:WD40 repeat protein
VQFHRAIPSCNFSVQLQRHSNGQHITLGTRIGGGGEGTVFDVPGTECVAKVYHKPTREMALKLVAMVSDPPIDPTGTLGHVSIAWPVDLLWKDRQAIGFLMPRVANMLPLHTVWTPKNRRDRVPLFNYLYLHRTARNLAAAFASLHASGHVVGDVNESNILVNSRALVSLVDTDSFQIYDRSRQATYRCPVGKPEFTPPELQGQSLREVNRTPAQDCFGLAVAIFQLLMEGTHPFGGVFQGQGDPPSIADRIASGHFLYSRQLAVPYRPTPIAPEFTMIAPRLQRLFVRCFDARTPRDRPNAQVWLHALDEAEHHLVTCDRNTQHRYDDGLERCPWCARTQKLGGRDPFPQKIADAQRWKDKPAPKHRARIVASSPAARTIAVPHIPLPQPRPSLPTQPSTLTPIHTSRPITPQPYTPPIALWTDLWRYRFDVLAGLTIVTIVLSVVYGIQYAERSHSSNESTTHASSSALPAIQNIAKVHNLNSSTSESAKPTDETETETPILALTDRYYGHTAPITAIAVAPQGDRFASSSENGVVRIWNRDREDILFEQPIGTSPGLVQALSFSTDGQTLVGAMERELIDWETDQLQTTNKRSLAANLQAVTHSPEGMLAFGLAPTLGATVWQLNPTMAVFRSIDRPSPKQASFSADGRWLALIDQAITVWDLETGQQIRKLDFEPDTPIAIALSPNGRYLAVSQPARSDTIELWSIADDQIVQSVLARDMTTLAFSPDGQSLLGGDRLGAISRWRLELKRDQ